MAKARKPTRGKDPDYIDEKIRNTAWVLTLPGYRQHDPIFDNWYLWCERKGHEESNVYRQGHAFVTGQCLPRCLHPDGTVDFAKLSAMRGGASNDRLRRHLRQLQGAGGDFTKMREWPPDITQL